MLARKIFSLFTEFLPSNVPLATFFFAPAYLHTKSLAANNTAKLISELYYVLVLERRRGTTRVWNTKLAKLCKTKRRRRVAKSICLALSATPCILRDFAKTFFRFGRVHSAFGIEAKLANPLLQNNTGCPSKFWTSS